MQKKKISTYSEEEVLYLKLETYGNRHVKIVLVITIDRNVFTLGQHTVGELAMRATIFLNTPYSHFHVDLKKNFNLWHIYGFLKLENLHKMGISSDRKIHISRSTAHYKARTLSSPSVYRSWAILFQMRRSSIKDFTIKIWKVENFKNFDIIRCSL